MFRFLVLCLSVFLYSPNVFASYSDYLFFDNATQFDESEGVRTREVRNVSLPTKPEIEVVKETRTSSKPVKKSGFSFSDMAGTTKKDGVDPFVSAKKNIATNKPKKSVPKEEFPEDLENYNVNSRPASLKNYSQ